MSEKKNIDRLFQEKFKDFEAFPQEQVWDNIEAELQKKKKRRVIPLWFRLSGVAALLLIGLALLGPLFKNDTENPVVTDGPENKTESPTKISPVLKPVPANGSVTDKSAAKKTEDAIVSQENNKNNIPNEGQDVEQGNNANSLSKKNILDNGGANAVAEGSKHKTNRKVRENTSNNQGSLTHKSNRDAVAYRNATSTKHEDETGLDNTSSGTGNTINSNEKGIASTGSDRDAESNTQADELINSSEENKLFADKRFTKNTIAEADIDTTTVVEENELEKLLNEKLKGDKKEGKEDLAEAMKKEKWGIRPQLAPVFYNSLSNGSPIDPSLAGNSKSFDNDLSFGVGLQYALNDRVTLRSGINTVNLSYSTEGIEFYASLSRQTSNVTAARPANIVVQNSGADKETLVADQLPAQKFNGSMIQKMGYIEVPLEMSYALVNKKFGIEVIGGISTLFLNDNNVSVVSAQGYGSNVGEASNLNDINFSTNVGLGFKYRFWKSFQANFEPMFKYQVNTFSSGSGNFKPYFVGLYSGISFSF
jgi:hypothetical protein